jgi:hypothetical protein
MFTARWGVVGAGLLLGAALSAPAAAAEPTDPDEEVLRQAKSGRTKTACSPPSGSGPTPTRTRWRPPPCTHRSESETATRSFRAAGVLQAIRVSTTLLPRRPPW